MSQGKLIAGAVGAVACILGVAVGYVLRGYQDEEDIKKTNNENERVRAQLKSVLTTFKEMIEKKDFELAQNRKEAEQLKWVIVELLATSPETLTALRERLRQFNLSTNKINVLEDMLAPIYRGQE